MSDMNGTKFCLECGAKIDSDTELCPYCSAGKTEQKRCAACGSMNASDLLFCEFCGSSLIDEAVSVDTEIHSHTVATTDDHSKSSGIRCSACGETNPSDLSCLSNLMVSCILVTRPIKVASLIS